MSGWLRKAGLALAEATRGVPFFPRSSLGYFYRGLLYARAGRHEEAIADYSQALLIDGSFAGALNDRGVCYQAQGLHGLALADFQKALTLMRRTPGCYNVLALAHCNRAISYKVLGEFDRAIDECETALKLNPHLISAHVERAASTLLSGRPALAVDLFDQALTLAPRSGEVLRGRGLAHFMAGDFAKAAADYARSFSYGSEPYAAFYLYLARRRCDQEAAAELQAHAGKQRVTGWEAQIAAFLLNQRSPEALLGAASTQSQHGEAAFYIGQQLLLEGKTDEAIACFESVLANCPAIFTEHIGAVFELDRLRARPRDHDGAERAATT
jgi:lipoprotein NlpI